MIVRRNLRLSNIIRLSWKLLLYAFIVSSIVTILYSIMHMKNIALPLGPFSALEGALAIFIAFRNNSAYDRWWEARKIWGEIVNYSRAFGKQVMTLLTDTVGINMEAEQKTLIYRHIAWLNALRMQLRRQSDWQSISHLIHSEEFDWLIQRQNKATMLVKKQGDDIRSLFERSSLDNYKHVEFDKTLTEFYRLQGKCERIKNTPFPRQYDFFNRSLLVVFITFLPFGFVGIFTDMYFGFFNVIITMTISFVFIMMDKIGVVNEDPFENRIEDIPMTALCRTIEIDMREQLGEIELPDALQPENGYLM